MDTALPLMKDDHVTATPTMKYSHSEAVRAIWSAADTLRGSYKAHDYGKIILPLVVLRRLDAALADTKQAVLDADAKAAAAAIENRDRILRKAAGGRPFYNTSKLNFAKVADDDAYVAENLRAYIRGFSPNVRDIIERFGFDGQIDKLAERSLLSKVMGKFVDLEIGPDRVTNMDMGYVFEDLIRRFSEQSNETAGEHFTPREVIHLMVDLLFMDDGSALSQPGRVVTTYDPACGTGGMLSVAADQLAKMNSKATLVPHGQELNDESYAIAKADMLIKGADAEIAFGNSFTEDGFAGRTFNYVIANPPYGVDWKSDAAKIKTEHEQLGYQGRFGPGLPSTEDGQMLFLLHMLSKLELYDPANGKNGGRLAVVLNGSPLFTGAPGGGESEIRRHMIENDLVEAIIGLPDSMFYNTGIHTYVWIVSNRKAPERQGKVQLIDARDLWKRMRKPLGMKRNELTDDHIAEIVTLYGDLAQNDRSRFLPNESFGFRRVRIKRPRRARYAPGPNVVTRLRANPNWTTTNVRMADADRADDVIAGVEQALQELPDTGTLAEALNTLKKHNDFKALLKKAKDAVNDALIIDDPDAEPLVDAKGNAIADSNLGGQETVPLPKGYDPDDDTVDPLTVGVDEYIADEITPHAPGAWADHSKTKLGYEIPFTRIFYRYEPPRPLEEIDADIKQVEADILAMLQEVTR